MNNTIEFFISMLIFIWNKCFNIWDDDLSKLVSTEKTSNQYKMDVTREIVTKCKILVIYSMYVFVWRHRPAEIHRGNSNLETS